VRRAYLRDAVWGLNLAVKSASELAVQMAAEWVDELVEQRVSSSVDEMDER
jgi:hypothetical protein